MEEGIGTEPVPEEAVREVEAVPVQGTGEGDLHFEDFPGDEFDKVGDFTSEESSQTPPAPVPEHPAETPSSDEPRKKRVKSLAGRTDLPWVRKLQALRAKTSSSAQPNIKEVPQANGSRGQGPCSQSRASRD